MLPLRDDIPSRTFPLVTISIIVLNVLAFLHETRLGRSLNDFLLTWSIIPIRYTNHSIAQQFNTFEQAIPFLSSMFLHGGWVHLIGNMWVLWIFGDNVEDRLGRFGYILLYLAGGIVAGLVHILTNPASAMPTIGASGAVAAVMGAYFRFFPHARVHTIIPPFFLGPIFELPAILFLGGWFLLQFYNGTLSLAARGSAYGGVAWFAHVGGFGFGMLVTFLLYARESRSPRSLHEREWNP
jgi:membrane associated rhomboid family serine protease